MWNKNVLGTTSDKNWCMYVTGSVTGGHRPRDREKKKRGGGERRKEKKGLLTVLPRDPAGPGPRSPGEGKGQRASR